MNRWTQLVNRHLTQKDSEVKESKEVGQNESKKTTKVK